MNAATNAASAASTAKSASIVSNLAPRRHKLVTNRMAEWNEDDIKAQLRELTSELRRLREELRVMIEPQKPNSRAFLHRQSWPAENPTAVVEDRRTRRPRKKI